MHTVISSQSLRFVCLFESFPHDEVQILPCLVQNCHCHCHFVLRLKFFLNLFLCCCCGCLCHNFCLFLHLTSCRALLFTAMLLFCADVACVEANCIDRNVSTVGTSQPLFTQFSCAHDATCITSVPLCPCANVSIIVS